MRTEPFSPDDLYCVYCHAPAAGQCAVCGALCCAVCAELELGLTLPRAVCRSCVERGRRPAGSRVRLVLVAGAAAVAALAIALLLWKGCRG